MTIITEQQQSSNREIYLLNCYINITYRSSFFISFYSIDYLQHLFCLFFCETVRTVQTDTRL